MTPRDRPIFVVGFQRSGTTLLQALLGAHPRIAAPPETYYVFRVADHAEYFGDLADDGNLQRALHEALNPPVDMFAGCGFDERVLLERARSGARTYAGLFEAIMGDFADRAGKQRWSEKSPGQPLEAALALFPQAQFVHIVRDPREVAASSLDAPGIDADARGIAREWRRFTLRNVRRGSELGPGQYLQVRYEDLTRDPEAVLRVVCAFLGEEYDPGMLDDTSRRGASVPSVASRWQAQALRAVEAKPEGEWKQRLSSRDQVRVNAVAGALATALGYEPPDVRTKLTGMPVSLGETARRVRDRLRRPKPAPSPEERYRLTRSFLESRAERVRETAASDTARHR